MSPTLNDTDENVPLLLDHLLLPFTICERGSMAKRNINRQAFAGHYLNTNQNSNIHHALSSETVQSNAKGARVLWGISKPPAKYCS